MWDYAKVTLQSTATDSESYPNLVSSPETELGELVVVVIFITLHRSPAMGVILLHPVRSEPSCNNMTQFTTKPKVSHSVQWGSGVYCTKPNCQNDLLCRWFQLVSFTKLCHVMLWSFMTKAWQRHHKRLQLAQTVHLLLISFNETSISLTLLQLWD